MGNTIRTTSVEAGMTLTAYIWMTPSNRIPHTVNVLSKTGDHPKTGMTIVMDKFTAESDGVSMSVNVDGSMKRITFKTIDGNEPIITPKASVKKPTVHAHNVRPRDESDPVVNTRGAKKHRADNDIVLPDSGTPYKTFHEIKAPNGDILQAIWDFNTWNFSNGKICEPRKLAAHGFRYVREIEKEENEI